MREAPLEELLAEISTATAAPSPVRIAFGVAEQLAAEGEHANLDLTLASAQLPPEVALAVLHLGPVVRAQLVCNPHLAAYVRDPCRETRRPWPRSTGYGVASPATCCLPTAGWGTKTSG